MSPVRHHFSTACTLLYQEESSRLLRGGCFLRTCANWNWRYRLRFFFRYFIGPELAFLPPEDHCGTSSPTFLCARQILLQMSWQVVCFQHRFAASPVVSVGVDYGVCFRVWVEYSQSCVRWARSRVASD